MSQGGKVVMPGGFTGAQWTDTFALKGFMTDRGDQLCNSLSPFEPQEYSFDAGKVEVSFPRSTCIMVAVQLGIHTKLEIHMHGMWGL